MNTYSYAYSNPVRWFDPFGLEVQVCCRPAEIANGTVDHCWVRTDAQDVGLSGNPNVRPGEEYESLYVTQTYPTDHSDDSASSCETMNNVDEQCVDDTLQDMLGEPQGGFGPANNCQQFAYSVVNQCRTGPQMLPEE